MNEKQEHGGPTLSFFRRWLRRTLVMVAVLLVMSTAFIGVAEHRTSQPEFCGSCHIMEPYHKSWQADLHGGKLAVACVECHYAPGERTTVKAKLRGLSQVASYVSGRYGATRPRAHVSNDSCLTSKCHGDRKFMDKVIDVGTVKFMHSRHLNLDAKQLEKSRQELAELSNTLRATVGDEKFVQLEAAAKESGPAEPRIDQLVALAQAWNAEIDRDKLQTFSQLQHRHVRFLQLADIQCTNCHSYTSPSLSRDAAKPTHHFSVNTTSCFTCHFNNEGFNTGTNTCLSCHRLPAGEIMVHEQLSLQESAKLQSPELNVQSIKMNHQAILERKVDCVACHADVAMEDSQVTRRDCERCHNQPRYFENWKEPFTVDLVASYHRVHVPGQRAKCLDCHSEIHHQLVRKAGDDTHPEFLSSVMSNCTHCHPSHHAEQLNLLSGSGGTAVPQSTPNLMFGSRTNCFGCHTEVAADEQLGDVVRATLNGCIACHGDRHSDTFEKWKQGLAIVQIDANEAYGSARKILDESTNIPEEPRRKATELLDAAKADLLLVKRGNGLHNVTYSMELLDAVTQRAQQAIGILSEAKKP